MNAQFRIVSDTWVRLRCELLADKRKTAVMGALLAVAVIIGLRLAISDSGPKKATAAQPATSVVAAGGDLPTAPPASHPQRSEVALYLEQIDSTVGRDLFATDYGVYPMAEVKPTRPDSDGSANSRMRDAALRERQRQEILVRGLAQKLVLQSTMPGDPPTAIINGQVVRPGQTFMDFEIRKIEFGSCLVAHGTIEVTLTME